jgi:putative ABC transport system substrate-binding protein
MTKKIVICLLIAALLATSSLVKAQQTGRVYRLGLLALATPDQYAPLRKVFEEGLRELGYVEGKNFIMESRFADGRSERLSNLAIELVRLKPDVIVTGTNSEIAALKQATTTIPIVMVHAAGPVEDKFITSLARPGGNITGLSMTASPELLAKRLELLKEMIPRLSRVALLQQANVPGRVASHEALKDAARKLKVKISFADVKSPDDIEKAFVTMIRNRAEAFLISGGPVTWMRRQQIAELALKNRLPGTHSLREYTEAGLLFSYGVNLEALFHRAATYVDKILKGAKPADLPVEQPAKFEFVINLKTAKRIGLTIPPNVLVRADRVIR